MDEYERNSDDYTHPTRSVELNYAPTEADHRNRLFPALHSKHRLHSCISRTNNHVKWSTRSKRIVGQMFRGTLFPSVLHVKRITILWLKLTIYTIPPNASGIAYQECFVLESTAKFKEQQQKMHSKTSRDAIWKNYLRQQCCIWDNKLNISSGPHRSLTTGSGQFGWIRWDIPASSQVKR